MKWWRFVVAMELRKILAYRSDFWVTFLGQTLIQILIARALWQSIFTSQGTEFMNGFSLKMMTLYYLISAIGAKILNGENIGFLAREIYDGSFSRYLIYPLSVFQYKTLTYLTYSAFYGLQLIVIFGLYHLFFISEVFTMTQLLNLLIGFGLFFLGALTYVMMSMAVELLALWAENVWSLMVMLRFFTNFFGGGFIPLSFFPIWALGILKFTPFPYLLSLPVRTIMGLTSLEEIGTGILILIFWIVFLMQIVQLLWSKGQKNYAGVGI